ncbi:alpha/beta hydrolase [Halococcus saccharolyticus]|uniref:Hydrolase of the alpha/beta superfamily-like protein n=1 Tax=Halococcus saccharolyticus DSM 5350 TaxID=1227455 RepID=M0ME80_9EURY|nr:CocE/NonD family hydrolase [Halococcus saccharolyticus]EMA44062.1 hydrolase of the alpha/beta superfamily-like protein [Halococcus saccharolyticus DSM 5350]
MDVVVPGGRDVRGTLDHPGDTSDESTEPDLQRVVVACPPHPQDGGTRSDRRLVAVSDALGDRGVACLRFDYGKWDEGQGEQVDVKNAVRWAREHADAVGLYGFSFGATMALCTAAETDGVRAVSALAPDRGREGADAVAALDGIDCPTQVLYAERDTTADWEPVVERARELGITVTALPADHFFVGQAEKVAAAVVGFFDEEW